MLPTGRRSPTPTTGQRLPSPGTGRQTPAPAALTASADTPAQTALGPRADPRATPLRQSSGGVSVPRARRSGTGKHIMGARSE